MNIEEKDLLNNFLESFSYDKVLAKYDIESCIAYTKMLSNKKIIDRDNAKTVIKILEKIQKETEKLQPEEDIHYSIEKTIENNLKAQGKDINLAGVIRTGRSRNDLVVNDERMYIRDAINEICILIKKLINHIVDVAQKNKDLIMCGNTHLQPAQPVLFAHYILSFAWMLKRDIERLKDCAKRNNVSVLGSAAFAGTTFDIDMEQIKKVLKFSTVTSNSVDAVSDRDYIIEYISSLAVIAMHLSRISEELIIWINPNFGYISLPDELTSGSSIMPQKFNPDFLELIRAKAARVYASLIGILTLLKALPLTYNRDMQEDKIYLFDASSVIKESLSVMAMIFKHLVVNKQNVEKTLEHDYIFATELANFLVRNFKISFKLAHSKVKNIIKYCFEKNKKLKELNLDEIKNLFKPLRINEDIYNDIKENLKLENVLKNNKSIGGTSPKELLKQIKILKSIKL